MLDNTGFNEVGLPVEVTIGDTLVFVDTISNYSPDEYKLSYAFSNGNVVDGVTDGDGWEFTILHNTFAKGGYVDFTRILTKVSDSTRQTVDSGTVEVFPDPTNLPDNYDARSHSKITLDNIQAVIEGRASVDQEAYTIAGRSLTRTPITELLKLRDYYQTLVSKENRRELAKRGVVRTRGRTVSFGNPYQQNPARRR